MKVNKGGPKYVSDPIDLTFGINGLMTYLLPMTKDPDGDKILYKFDSPGPFLKMSGS